MRPAKRGYLLLIIAVVLVTSALAAGLVNNRKTEAQATWTTCASEGGFCSFSGTKEVIYGGNNSWTKPQAITNGVACDNATFGDPIVGTPKECRMRDNTGKIWAYCGSENSVCTLSGTQEVIYGANNSWTIPRSFTGTTGCNNSVFGDPIPGVEKVCLRGDAPVAPPTPPTPPPSPPGIAGEKPYFRAINGSVFAGGGFDEGTTPCSDPSLNPDENYQSPKYTGPSSVESQTQYKGAIMTWTNTAASTRTGSGSVTTDPGGGVDAYATGLIEGSTPTDPNYGYYTGLSGSGPGPNGSRSLSFNNVKDFGVNAFWGGMVEGDNKQAHCVPDYYTTKRKDPIVAVDNWNGISFPKESNEFDFSGAAGRSLTVGAARTIPKGKKLAIFATTDVHIDANITYESNNKITDISKFVLVVKGHSLTIAPNVTRLDGWYIIIPQVTGTSGQFFTCNDSDPLLDMTDQYIRTFCVNQLMVNGAITAHQLKLNRINGDLGGPSAEDINYVPENVLGGSFFEDDPSNGVTGKIDSLINLPPVF